MPGFFIHVQMAQHQVMHLVQVHYPTFLVQISCLGYSASQYFLFSTSAWPETFPQRKCCLKRQPLKKTIYNLLDTWIVISLQKTKHWSRSVTANTQQPCIIVSKCMFSSMFSEPQHGWTSWIPLSVFMLITWYQAHFF